MSCYFDATVDESVEIDVEVIEDRLFLSFVFDVIEDQGIAFSEPASTQVSTMRKSWGCPFLKICLINVCVCEFTSP